MYRSAKVNSRRFSKAEDRILLEGVKGKFKYGEIAKLLGKNIVKKK